MYNSVSSDNKGRLTSESDYFICFKCGADVPSEAQACTECSSGDKTGWTDLFKNRYFLYEVIISIVIFLWIYLF